MILVPGMGDDVQTIKAGIMEIADIFVINKSDREGAERVEREIRALQSLATRHDGWTPPIVKTVASEGNGVEELAAAIAEYESYLQKENRALKKSVENWQERLVEMLRDAMLEKARAQLGDGTDAAGGGSGGAQAGSVHADGRDCRGVGSREVRAISDSRFQIQIERLSELICDLKSSIWNSLRGFSVDFSIDHLGIAVKSLAAAKAIYEKLGLSVSPKRPLSTRQVRLVMVPVGESRLELLEATSEDSTIAKFIAKRGEGLHHVCLKVPDLPAAVERLKKDGVRLVRRKSRPARAGISMFSFIRRARAACCWSWCRGKTLATDFTDLHG